MVSMFFSQQGCHQILQIKFQAIPGYFWLNSTVFQVFPDSVGQIPGYHLENCNIDNAAILVIFQIFR